MARITVKSKRDFLRLLDEVSSPNTHFAVSDDLSTIVLVPKSTSRHRHYIWLNVDDEADLQELTSKLEEKGYTVVNGTVKDNIPG